MESGDRSSLPTQYLCISLYNFEIGRYLIEIVYAPFNDQDIFLKLFPKKFYLVLPKTYVLDNSTGQSPYDMLPQYVHYLNLIVRINIGYFKF